MLTSRNSTGFFIKFMEFLLVFTILYGLLPLLLFLIKRNRLSPEVSLMLPFFCLVFIASLYEYIGTILMHLNVKYWFILYEFLVSIALFYFFYFLLKEINKSLFWFYIFLFSFVTINSILIWSGDNFFDICSYYNLLQTIFILTFSIIWIKRVFNNLELESFISSSTFYFISGLILYYSGTVFLFLLSNLIFKMDKTNFQDYWMLNIILNLVLRTLLILGIWKGQMR